METMKVLSDVEMDWFEAKKWCKHIGPGWKMPSRLEVVGLYDNKEKGFNTCIFWTSTEHSSTMAFVVNFVNGESYQLSKHKKTYVLATKQVE